MIPLTDPPNEYWHSTTWRHSFAASSWNEWHLFQYFQDEFEGWGIEVDVNAGAISPSGGVTLDDNGNITGGWGGLSKGPGIGACALVTKSNSFTIGNALDGIGKAWNWAKSWF